MNHSLLVTFRTGCRLSDREVNDLVDRVLLEIHEPTTTGEDGLPTDSEWSGRDVRIVVVDDHGHRVTA